MKPETEMSWADIQELEDLEQLKDAELKKNSVKTDNKPPEKIKRRPKKDRNTKTN